ncbi:glycosyltransferase family 92 protein Os08g0121900-like [Triticum dicoccoides]|uniref:glycosyltransferase family 92 protein Os08g0121900-like n=1 Tax=Triticum dicoccoides TaxID=85692 RepID=UPI001891E2CE|nr:glycosyltransferase family 92 protein Os08g0121900-like [Triticum dicoccoides]
MPRHRRCSRLRRIVGGVSVGALLLLAGSGGHNAYSGRPVFSLPLGLGAPFPLVADSPAPPPFPFAADFSPSPSPSPQSQYSPFRLSDDSLARRLLPLRLRAGHSPPPQEADAVLLPDQEVLVLDDTEPTGDAICAFQGGASSPARPLGRLPASGLHSYVCRLPEPAQSFQQLQAPLLLHSSTSSAAAAALDPPSPSPGRALLNWSSDPIVFDSALLDGGDVLVFAKGISRRQGLQCLYRYSDGAGTMLASTPAISSVQQVTRCPSPPTPVKSGGSTKFLVTLGVTGEDPMPSLATFRRQQAESSSLTPHKSSICACTMGRNISKFLREWALYHSAIGVDQFFIYDNGSEDNLAGLVAQLISSGLNITTVPWPWTKVQEAGLSHCAATQQASCQWMAVIDVDEFIFSTSWAGLEKPSKSLLEPVISVDDSVGQIYLACYDFAPSGQTAHPPEGVCQGYTCRLKNPQRHKSLVRLDAVEPSLMNVVHHFKLKPAFKSIWTALARVNHYKYQAWSEFKVKFKRRVSAYVADWKDPINLDSKDRAPGLGVDDTEPKGWAQRYCEVKDNILQLLTARWFGVGFGNPH